MARASEKRGSRPRPNARQRARTDQPVARKEQAQKRRPEYEDQLFFSKLRGRAKWVFAVLAGIFALSFVALGVGTGVSGGNLGDVIRDVFGGGSDTPSVADALEGVQDNPGDPEAVRDLAAAYVAAQQYRDAAATLEDYVELRPDDAEAIRQLTTVYARLAGSAAREAAGTSSPRAVGQSFAAQAYLFPESSGFFGALGDDPVEAAVDASFARSLSGASEEAERWQQLRADTYEKLAAARPSDPTILIQLGSAAAAAGNYEQATRAYERYLAAEPDGEYADQAREQLDQLADGDAVLTG